MGLSNHFVVWIAQSGPGVRPVRRTHAYRSTRPHRGDGGRVQPSRHGAAPRSVSVSAGATGSVGVVGARGAVRFENRLRRTPIANRLESEWHPIPRGAHATV